MILFYIILGWLEKRRFSFDRLGQDGQAQIVQIGALFCVPVIAGHEPHQNICLVRGENDFPEGYVVVLSRIGGVVLHEGLQARNELPVRLPE